MSETNTFERDDKCIGIVKRRLLRAHRRLGTWRLVGEELGVNHGNLVTLVQHGRVPRDADLRIRLKLPRVMPSERKPRVKKVIPLLGSECWKCMAFKTIRPKRRNR
jgi:hypothetical protein